MLIRENWLYQYMDYIPIDKIKIVYDVGARRGESAQKFLKFAKHVYCFEPNADEFKHIESIENATLIKAAASDVNCDAYLNKKHGTGQCFVTWIEKENPIKCVRIDDLDLPSPDFIKIDTENHELRVIIGAHKTIEKHRPSLAIACYHTMFQCFEVHQYIHNNFPFYRFECANYSNGNPYETILYCINKEN